MIAEQLKEQLIIFCVRNPFGLEMAVAGLQLFIIGIYPVMHKSHREIFL